MGPVFDAYWRSSSPALRGASEQIPIKFGVAIVFRLEIQDTQACTLGECLLVHTIMQTCIILRSLLRQSLFNFYNLLESADPSRPVNREL